MSVPHCRRHFMPSFKVMHRVLYRIFIVWCHIPEATSGDYEKASFILFILFWLHYFVQRKKCLLGVQYTVHTVPMYSITDGIADVMCIGGTKMCMQMWDSEYSSLMELCYTSSTFFCFTVLLLAHDIVNYNIYYMPRYIDIFDKPSVLLLLLLGTIWKIVQLCFSFWFAFM